MSEAHDHDHAPAQTFRYTIWLRTWWGNAKIVIVATGSQREGDELILYEASGVFHSINYRHMVRLMAEPVSV